MNPNTPVATEPIRYIFLCPIRSDKYPAIGTVKNDIAAEAMRAPRSRSRELPSTVVP
jgi:hypothetical protein